MGMAMRLVPPLERHAIGVRRWLLRSLPGLVGVVLVLAGSVFAAGWVKERREAGRPLPPAGSPNVLLIVMDTVRADHMSLYGYHRATTPRLQQFARQGILFENVRATAPWTLPSHASLFTGRWPHELGVEWMTPLRGTFPTLAEYLGSRGYATAGFVANTLFLFVRHRHRPGLRSLRGLRARTARGDPDRAGGRPRLQGGVQAGPGLRPGFDAGSVPPRERPRAGVDPGPRSDHARAINLKFVDWLARRREPGRPFFAFLNYYDAHAPYIPPTIAGHRFGLSPKSLDDAKVLDSWIDLNKLELPAYFQVLARDAYDNCLAYLDEQLGELFEELQRRGELDRTWVIVTSDHGEGLGEHDLFDHGESLYRTEIGVPLVIVAPSAAGLKGLSMTSSAFAICRPRSSSSSASRRARPSPARRWPASGGDRQPIPVRARSMSVISELTGPNPSHPNQGRSPAGRGPLFSLADGDYVYIRNEGDGAEELFDERDDPGELRNQAGVEALQPVLKRFRERVRRLRARP